MPASKSIEHGAAWFSGNCLGLLSPRQDHRCRSPAFPVAARTLPPRRPARFARYRPRFRLEDAIRSQLGAQVTRWAHGHDQHAHLSAPPRFFARRPRSMACRASRSPASGYFFSERGRDVDGRSRPSHAPASSLPSRNAGRDSWPMPADCWAGRIISSIHPGGVVITPGPIEESAPLQRAP